MDVKQIALALDIPALEILRELGVYTEQFTATTLVGPDNKKTLQKTVQIYFKHEHNQKDVELVFAFAENTIVATLNGMPVTKPVTSAEDIVSFVWDTARGMRK